MTHNQWTSNPSDWATE